MEALIIVAFALLGMEIGSFLNVCADRLPAGRSLVRPRSCCDNCQRPLSIKDLVPVFSYLWLRGRCRHCHAPIPRRVFWIEIGTGALFAFLYWHYGLTAELAVTAFYCSIFIVILIIDLEHKLILNRIVYPAAAAALLISIFLPQPEILHLPWPQSINGIIAGAIGFVLLLVPALISRGGMGWGDVKMAGLIGLATGFPLVFVAIIGGIVVGGLVAVILLLLRLKTRKDAIPFGPFLALATMATLLYGRDILNWYLSIF